MNPVAQLVTVTDGDDRYEAIQLWCPGCQYEREDEPGHYAGGLNMLPVVRGGQGGDTPRPTWGWNGDLVAVTLTPSILTRSRRGEAQAEFACHSFLTNGRWHFLADCTHSLAGQTADMLPLPDWVVRDRD